MSLFKCKFCNFTSTRAYNLNRHENNKHLSKTTIVENEINEIIDTEVQYIISLNEEFICDRCNGKYKNKQNLEKHYDNCNGIDILTCTKCMFSFINRFNKSKHLKNNNCNHRSIIYYKNFKTLRINDFGNERTNYITNSEMITILKSGINSICNLVKIKHFNEKFPENNNICFNVENRKCLVKKEHGWSKLSLFVITSLLINNNASILLNFCNNNKEYIINELKNDELFEEILTWLLNIKYKNDIKIYNELSDKFLIILELNSNIHKIGYHKKFAYSEQNE